MDPAPSANPTLAEVVVSCPRWLFCRTELSAEAKLIYGYFHCRRPEGHEGSFLLNRMEGEAARDFAVAVKAIRIYLSQLKKVELVSITSTWEPDGTRLRWLRLPPHPWMLVDERQWVSRQHLKVVP